MTQELNILLLNLPILTHEFCLNKFVTCQQSFVESLRVTKNHLRIYFLECNINHNHMAWYFYCFSHCGLQMSLVGNTEISL